MDNIKSKADLQLEGFWLTDIADFTNEIEFERQPFVRTETINGGEGCFIEGCPFEERITRHHIRRGRRSLVVHLCWDHHQIIHGVALKKYPLHEIQKVYQAAEEHGLWKEGEKNRVKKIILTEIEKRMHMNDNMKAFFDSIR
jgi:hypothetical protein